MTREVYQHAGASSTRKPASTSAPSRKTDDRLWTPLFVLIIALTLCCFLVGQGLNAGTSVYLSRGGWGAAFAGVLAAVFSFAAAQARLVCGPLIDRGGRFRVLFTGIVLLTVGTLAPALFSDGTVFIASRIVQGVGFSAATTAAATAAADVLPTARLGEGIGYYGLGQAIAMSIGPAFALFLVSTDPAENLYFGLAAVAAIGCALTLCCRYENHPEKLPATCAFRKRAESVGTSVHTADAHAAGAADSRQSAACAEGSRAQRTAAHLDDSSGNEPETSCDTPNAQHASGRNSSGGSRVRALLSATFEPKALPGALPMLVLGPAFGFSIFFVGLYGTSLGIENAGMFYTLSAVSMIAVRLKSKSFMDRIAPIKVFTAAMACGMVAFTLLIASSALHPLFYIAGLIYGLFLGVSLPLNQSVAVKNSPPDRWGATNALFLLANDIGIGIGSMVWGFVNDSAGFTVSLVCVMGCVVASYLTARVVYPKDDATA